MWTITATKYLCTVYAVAEEDCDSRSALVTVQTTDKKKGLLRSLFRLGKLTKKDSKSSYKPAQSSAVKRKPTSPLMSAAVTASQSIERRDVDAQQPM